MANTRHPSLQLNNAQEGGLQCPVDMPSDDPGREPMSIAQQPMRVHELCDDHTITLSPATGPAAYTAPWPVKPAMPTQAHGLFEEPGLRAGRIR